MNSRVSVLIDIRSKLAGLEQASAGFGQLIKTVAGFAAAYLSARAVVSGAREIITLGGDLAGRQTCLHTLSFREAGPHSGGAFFRQRDGQCGRR